MGSITGISLKILQMFSEKVELASGQVENSEIAETMKIREIAVEQGNYKFCQ